MFNVEMFQECSQVILPMFSNAELVVEVSQVGFKHAECIARNSRASMNRLTRNGDRVEPIAVTSVCLCLYFLYKK